MGGVVTDNQKAFNSAVFQKEELSKGKETKELYLEKFLLR